MHPVYIQCGKSAVAILILFLLFANPAQIQAQTERFDVFSFQSPPFFIKSESGKSIHFTLENDDTSFCTISLYKTEGARKDLKFTVMKQWNSLVYKQLTKADKKPAKIMTGEKLDGWQSALAIGNFYHNKKKSVVMLYSFRRGNESACAVFAFSDKLFKLPVEEFSSHLHLVNGEW
jgi:hypothetical protein